MKLQPPGSDAQQQHTLHHQLAYPSLLVTVAAGFAIALACLSLLIWACQAISVTHAIATDLISGTAGMASSLPDGVGVNEAATVLLLHQQRIPVEIALTIAILRRLVSPWSIVGLAALLGAFYPNQPTMPPEEIRQNTFNPKSW